ncbi:MAG: DUF5996 family protein [Xanthobacteraceae bacterium]
MRPQQTDRLDWRPVKRVDLRRMVEARLQAHYAVQWLARIARAYIPPQPDDGHTSLLWERARDALMTQPLKTRIYFSVRIPDLVLALHDGSSPLKIIHLADHSDLEIRESLGKKLSAQGFDADALDAPSPYELPPHAIAHGAKYDAVRSQEDVLAEFAAWFGNAKLLLSDLQRKMSERRLTASPARCWPHHFDISTLITLPVRDSDAIGYIGAGLSPGDEYYEAPYFYVSVSPEPAPALLPQLPGGGHWHTEEFTAAVLTWDEVPNTKAQKAAANDFLHSAVAIALNILADSRRFGIER